MAFMKRVTLPATVTIGGLKLLLEASGELGVRVRFDPDDYSQSGFKTYGSQVAIPGAGTIAFSTAKGAGSVLLVLDMPRHIKIEITS